MSTINTLQLPPVTSGSANLNYNSDSLFDSNGIQKHKTPFIQYKTYELTTTSELDTNVETITFSPPNTFYQTPDHHYVKLHITAFRDHPTFSTEYITNKIMVFGTRGKINVSDNSFEAFRHINTSNDLSVTSNNSSGRPFRGRQLVAGSTGIQIRLQFYSTASRPTTVKIISYVI